MKSISHIEPAGEVAAALPAAASFMSPALDWLSLQFVIRARKVRGEVLDLGCGTGIAAQAVLQRGGHVCAVDPEPRHIAMLRDSVPVEQHARLRDVVGALPRLTLPPASFIAIHAAYVLQLLPGAKFGLGLTSLSRWLQPGGRLYLSLDTPHGTTWRHLELEYKRRQQRDVRWPGFFEQAIIGPQGAQFIHLSDASLLARECERVGLIVEEAENFGSRRDPSPRAHCGVVARLPA